MSSRPTTPFIWALLFSGVFAAKMVGGSIPQPEPHHQMPLQIQTSCPVQPEILISSWSSTTDLMCSVLLQSPSLEVGVSTHEHENQLPKPLHCVHGLESSIRYCIYTFPRFASGRGLSLLTTPSVASSIAAMLHDDWPHLYPLGESSLFYEMALPGRGKGLISNSTYHKGDLILISTPLFIVNEQAMTALSSQQRLSLQQLSIESLPSKSRELYYALAGHFGGDRTEDVLLTNGFSAGFGDPKEGHGIVVPEAARLNHDCRPNARFAFDPKFLVHKVHATATIHPGEELTFSYIDEKQKFAARQRQIKSHWGFECNCNLCSSSELSRALSDSRLERLAYLRTSLLSFATPSILGTTPEMALEMIELYETENLAGTLAEAYMLAAFRYCIWEFEVETKKWASLAIDHWLVWEAAGTSNLDTVRKLGKDPKAVWCWGTKRRAEKAKE